MKLKDLLNEEHWFDDTYRNLQRNVDALKKEADGPNGKRPRVKELEKWLGNVEQYISQLKKG